MEADGEDGLPGMERMRDREFTDPARLGDQRAGSLFEHKALTDPSNAAPVALSARLPSASASLDGSEREPRVEPWDVPIRSFFTYDLGQRHDGPLPPVSRSTGSTSR